MICNDEKIAELLPWFVNDTLPTSEKIKIKAHLQHCLKCQSDLEEMKKLSEQIKKGDKELLSEHILSEKLVCYAEAKGDLSKEDINFVEAHLKTCSQCQQELRILEKVNASLKKGRTTHSIAIIKDRINALFSQVSIKPALAYIIILFLLYPAYLGIFERKKVTEPHLAQQNYELFQFDSRAGSGSTNEIRLTPQTHIFSLSFNLPVLVDENISYDAEILDAKKKVMWKKKDIKSLDEYGTFLIICHREFFSPGIYTLKIDEINRRENRVENEFVFSFKVKVSNN